MNPEDHKPLDIDFTPLDNLSKDQLRAWRTEILKRSHTTGYQFESERLQMGVLERLAFIDSMALILAGSVTPDHFSGVNRQIADRLIGYVQKYKKAPGEDLHVVLDPLYWVDGKQIETPEAEEIKRRVQSLWEQWRRGGGRFKMKSNDVVMDIVSNIITREDFRRAVYKVGNITESTPAAEFDEVTADDCSRIWTDVYGKRFMDDKRPTTASDVDLMLSDSRQEENKVLPTGLTILDNCKAGPVKGGLHVMLALFKAGKSFWLQHVGLEAAACRDFRSDGKRCQVLHISLENPASTVRFRYRQAVYNIARKPGLINYRGITADKDGEFMNAVLKDKEPDFVLNEGNYRADLAAAMRDEKNCERQKLLDAIRIEYFTNGSLSAANLVSYLDRLKYVDGWVPDLLIIDYAACMNKPNRRENRHELEAIYGDLCHIASERNIAIATAHQANREAIGARRVTAKNIAEDMSALRLADTVLTLTRNQREEEEGLARVGIEVHRNGERAETVISQQYATGIFSIDGGCRSNNEYAKYIGGRGDG